MLLSYTLFNNWGHHTAAVLMRVSPNCKGAVRNLCTNAKFIHYLNLLMSHWDFLVALCISAQQTGKLLHTDSKFIL